jgi:hypothetical protein
LGSTGSQAIDFSGSSVEAFVVDKPSGTATLAANMSPDSFTLTNGGSFDADVYDITIADGGNFLADSTGEFDAGTGTISLTNGDFDNSTVGTWTPGTAEVLLSGVGAIVYKTNVHFYQLTIAASASITMGAGQLIIDNTLTVDGTFDVSGQLSSFTTNQTTLGTDGNITGSGIFLLNTINSGGGIVAMGTNAVIDIATLLISRPASTGVLVPATYDSPLVTILSPSATPKILTLSATPSIPYVFTGDVEFESTDGGGSLTIANNTNNPNIEIQGDVIWTETAGTITYTAGTGDLTLSGTADQDIDFGGQQPEDFSVAKSAGALNLNSGTFVAGANSAAFDFACSGDADVDMATFDLTLADGGDFLADSSGEFDAGTGTISLTNGNYTYTSVGTYTGGTSTLSMSGTGNLAGKNSSAQPLYNLDVTSGAVVTVTAILWTTGTVTVDGTLSLNNLVSLRDNGVGTVVGAAGQITGAGTYVLRSPLAGQGLLTFAGTIDVARFEVQHPAIGAIIAANTFDCGLFYVSGTAASAAVLELSGAYIFTGDVELASTNASGSLTLDNSVNDPDIEIQGDFIWTETVGTLTYTPGLGDFTCGGAANQDIDFSGSSLEDFIVNKSAGAVTLLSSVSPNSVLLTDGTLDIDGNNLTTVGNFTAAAGTTTQDTATGGLITVGDTFASNGTSPSPNIWNGPDLDVTTAGSASYTTVTNSDASAGVDIDATDGTNTDLGGNPGWLFFQEIVGVGISTAEAVGSAAITTTVDVAPVGVVSAEATGSPVVSPGVVSVAPAGVVSAEGIGLLSVDLILYATGIATAEDVSSPVVTLVAVGGLIVAPPSIVSAEVVGVHQVTGELGGLFIPQESLFGGIF